MSLWDSIKSSFASDQGQDREPIIGMLFDESVDEDAIETYLSQNPTVNIEQIILGILGEDELYDKLTAADECSKIDEEGNANDERYWKSPFGRACVFLGDEPSYRMIAALERFVASDRSYIHEKALLVVGKTGHLKGLNLMRQAIGHVEKDDAYGGRCSSVLAGLSYANLRDRVSIKLCRRLYDDLLKAFESENVELFLLKTILNLLSLADSQKLLSYLTSETFWNINNPRLHLGLRILPSGHDLFPRERIIKLAEDLLASDLTYPKDYALKEAVVLLGAYQDLRDKDLLLRLSEHGNEKAARGAVDALLLMHGLADVETQLFRAQCDDLDDETFKEQPSSVQHFLIVMIYAGFLDNGGFGNYLWCSEGWRVHDFMTSLQEVGDHDRSEIVKRAIKAFGEQGIPDDDEQRMKIMEDFGDPDDKGNIVNQLDDAYFGTKQPLDVVAARYILKHSSDFLKDEENR